jgi:plastocyanin domain-containing protein
MRQRALTVLLPALLSVGACSRAPESGSTSAPGAPPQPRHITVVVGEDGFVPSSIPVAKGEPVMLMFKRTVEKTCATAVEFPELKLKKELPLNQEVAVDVPTGERRTLSFQCGMGMYKSKVVIQ